MGTRSGKQLATHIVPLSEFCPLKYCVSQSAAGVFHVPVTYGLKIQSIASLTQSPHALSPGSSPRSQYSSSPVSITMYRSFCVASSDLRTVPLERPLITRGQSSPLPI